MPYTKQTWADKPATTSPISAARLGYMEDGIEAAGRVTVTSEAGTSYTFVLADEYKRFTSASAVAATVPPNSSVAYPIGTTLHIEQGAAGAVTITPGSGVTINVHADFTLVTDGQYAVASVTKVATDTWTAYGKLVPA